MPSAHIVVGLGWGDEGKGATVDAIAAHTRADRVVRFNGGQQASHNVIVAGVHHTFQSYGSATFLGVPTWLSQFCTVEPTAALRERRALDAMGVPTDPINTDRDCLVTTWLHIAANRAREAARGDAKHGSTGRGFGETIAYSLDHPEAAPRVADLSHPARWWQKIAQLASHYVSDGLLELAEVRQAQSRTGQQLDTMTQVLHPVSHDELLDQLGRGHTIFEGAQGFWLDENFGFQPHTTWSTTTPANARRLAREAGIDDVTTVGCLRTYATRHGAGPLPGEGLLAVRPAEPHNSDQEFAGRFRVGAHDPDVVRAALRIAQPDTLSISHLDRFEQFATINGPLPLDSFGTVMMTATGPDRHDRHFTEGSPTDARL